MILLFGLLTLSVGTRIFISLEHVIATFGAMALRVPSNCDRILACGGGKTITQALRRFPEGPVSLQRQCCLAVSLTTTTKKKRRRNQSKCLYILSGTILV